MSVPLTLLGLLEREPSHGYDLKRDYDAYFGRRKPLPFGQVYATLGRLARDGKVVAADAEPGAGPDRKRYVITDLGVSQGVRDARCSGSAADLEAAMTTSSFGFRVGRGAGCQRCRHPGRPGVPALATPR
jgi:Transcriptional regulator PadR-like family